MEDFYDDFDDDFDNGDFMDEDFFEDNLEDNLEMSEPFEGDTEFDDELREAESKEDEFTARDAFFLGSAIGWGYEEGLTERKRRKRKKFKDNSE